MVKRCSMLHSMVLMFLVLAVLRIRRLSPRTAPKGGLKVYKVTNLYEQDCKPCNIIKCKTLKPLIYNDDFIYNKDKETPSVIIKPIKCEMGSCITKGYHSYIDKYSMGIVDEKSRIIGEFLIPSGIRYYLNECGGSSFRKINIQTLYTL